MAAAIMVELIALTSQLIVPTRQPSQYHYLPVCTDSQILAPGVSVSDGGVIVLSYSKLGEGPFVYTFNATSVTAPPSAFTTVKPGKVPHEKADSKWSLLPWLRGFFSRGRRHVDHHRSRRKAHSLLFRKPDDTPSGGGSTLAGDRTYELGEDPSNLFILYNTSQTGAKETAKHEYLDSSLDVPPESKKMAQIKDDFEPFSLISGSATQREFPISSSCGCEISASAEFTARVVSSMTKQLDHEAAVWLYAGHS
ncbi:hypothetical protein EGW08_001465 [Elysia chlorotica]|uniref:Uncharacterized protein n=1 Tax=Elysia chlorotica TaxID=188477 RepID=A0A433UA95_ELYCH|nr:hypothetical protein EGW08_001465 [Elysia chlorotica]